MSSNSYVLPSNMTIGNIGICHSQLFNLLEMPDEVFIDVAKLQQIDTCGIQLILRFTLEAEKINLKVSWLNNHEVLAQMIVKLGFEKVLLLKSET